MQKWKCSQKRISCHILFAGNGSFVSPHYILSLSLALSNILSSLGLDGNDVVIKWQSNLIKQINSLGTNIMEHDAMQANPFDSLKSRIMPGNPILSIVLRTNGTEFRWYRSKMTKIEILIILKILLSLDPRKCTKCSWIFTKFWNFYFDLLTWNLSTTEVAHITEPNYPRHDFNDFNPHHLP